MSIIAILTAGGTGTRTHQDLPKQFITVENKPIIIYTLEAFQQHPSIDEIYVSCLEGWNAVLEAYAKQFNITKLKRIVTGGATGQESIYNGLKAIKQDNESTDDIVVAFMVSFVGSIWLNNSQIIGGKSKRNKEI